MRIAALLSSLTCIAAGVYLLQSQAVDDNSLIEVIMHGMGIYFIGKGLYLGPSLRAQAKAATHLEELARRDGGPPATERSTAEAGVVVIDS